MKIEVKMNDGLTFIATVDNYSASQLVEDLNDNAKQMIAIGDVIVQRYSVSWIKPFIEETV